ncbi:uncharacterized protein B0I36DRAFT_358852 [Microdochium trichocladiopsis]|uniref:Fucose-specific lectin n=1 Tax=Microdochium trichocladiopsis TaxID=1682393 RepID=A0A9P9BRQ7_9PEZI|nr:uncharacterized protein B0I36DRAFT_358852 [Microdochium trichocladiopsis]KAH7037105.1 hypothetical protein B0I36DRAFT_358852 [Microdochium trichocladiopsis]
MGASSLWSLGLFAATASAGHLAAWWTNDFGPTLMMQDDASAGIRYSLCNSHNTPIFPNDTSITMPLLKFPPKNGTALAGGGWWDQKNVVASIFYFNQKNEIVNSLLQCDDRTGHWSNTGDYVISSGAPKAANNSDLSMALLGAKEGYRVLYNGLDGAVQLLSYNNDNGWRYGGVAYNASSSANVIASIYPPADTNITLLVPRDSQNMGLARFYGDNTWHIESFPTPLNATVNNTIITNSTNPNSIHLNATFVPTYSLPAWDGKPKSMGMAEDSSWTRSVFYVGTDKQLHQIGNLDYKWLVFDRPSNNASWPQSDDGYLAVANDFNSDSLRVYYMSNGKLIEANGDSGKWQSALVLPSYNATAPAPTNTPTNNPGSEAGTGENSSELSTGAKAGIGVGVTLAVLAIVGIVVAVILLKRRQKRQQEADAAAAAAGSTVGGSTAYSGAATEPKYQDSPSTAYGVPGELHSEHTGTTAGGSGGDGGYYYYNNNQPPPQHQQYNSNQMYELPDQSRRAEMIGEGHYKEAP